jgi:uracil-DNA glycosylase
MPGSYAAALAAFLDGDRCQPAGRPQWSSLPFLAGKMAASVCARVDERVALGGHVLPPATDTFNALKLAPLASVRVVILGQDPYPTPGDAHGLAFSYIGRGHLPASLRNIFKELAQDLGRPQRRDGDLRDWAGQGVLLLNTALTVEAGQAGAHLKFGWHALADEAIAAVSRHSAGAVFILWGAPAQKRRPLIDENRHAVIASAHPSPLSAQRGFFGSKPFSRANAWLSARGQPAIAW